MPDGMFPPGLLRGQVGPFHLVSSAGPRYADAYGFTSKVCSFSEVHFTGKAQVYGRCTHYTAKKINGDCGQVSPRRHSRVCA
ncbi:MAG: hypothetical protein AVDCRST_MAG56-7681 [uncultured Cytophagales bacterium]|uniref:Uncharacterized protein n=1 Tax=uncultured Cytophagales bacterium TaxID=158755 RepID=A0A6J4LME8_9SPHI|nr:MAG: hypothetical protein AVDCRST_MAG56-7681 [uncultured Cytophagales bacterium]